MTAITERHHAFARAVVALARQHHMNDLSVEFSESSSHNLLKRIGGYERVTMRWTEGRHGETNNIQLECRAVEGIPEREPEQPK